MQSLEEIFSKSSEELEIFEKFKAIENIYENSLIAMGLQKQTTIASASTSISMTTAGKYSTKDN